MRVVLVDDQVLLRRGLRMMIDAEADLEVVGEAGDGGEVVELARRTTPDVVLMDIRMPHVDGVEATRRLLGDAGRPHEAGDARGGADGGDGGAQAGPRGPRVLVLTTFDLDDYVVEALRAGASGFLLKDAAPDDIVNGIRVVAAGDALLAPSVTRRLLSRFVAPVPGDDGARPTLPKAPSAAVGTLTEREHEVLALIVRGLSNAEIGARLYLSEATVKTHVGRVLMKLGVRDRVQAVVLAYETGLVEPGRG